VTDPAPLNVDPQTGELVPCRGCEQLTRQVERAKEDYSLQERALRSERRLRAKAEKERDDAFAEDPDADQVREVLEHWRELLHPRALIPLGGKRAEKVRGRLSEGHTVRDLKQAVDGARAFPYDVGYGRRSASGSKDQQRTDLTYVCRDETTVAKLQALALSAPFPGDGPGDEDRPLEAFVELYVLAVAALDDAGVPGGGAVHERVGWLVREDRSNVVPLRRDVA
jgi:hypothetical protein